MQVLLAYTSDTTVLHVGLGLGDSNDSPLRDNCIGSGAVALVSIGFLPNSYICKKL